MPDLRCKPGQTAMIVRPSMCEPCSVRMVGLPTVVAALTKPGDPGYSYVMDRLEGPVWRLAQPMRCPMAVAGCGGMEVYPDQHLRPFDPESEPEPAAEDAPVRAPVDA